jgi:hypothetical protein
MTNTATEKRQFMELTNRLFKGVEDKAPNSLTPSIMYHDILKKDVDKVVFYAPLDDYAESFLVDNPANITTDFETQVENIRYSKTKDLNIRIALFDGTDFPILETCIIGKDAKRMKEFLDALNKVDKILIILASSNHDFICFSEYSWDYNLFKEDLDEIYESLPENLKKSDKTLGFSDFKTMFKIQNQDTYK